MQTGSQQENRQRDGGRKDLTLNDVLPFSKFQMGVSAYRWTHSFAGTVCRMLGALTCYTTTVSTMGPNIPLHHSSSAKRFVGVSFFLMYGINSKTVTQGEIIDTNLPTLPILHGDSPFSLPCPGVLPFPNSPVFLLIY